jgi:hypothetical protein
MWQDADSSLQDKLVDHAMRIANEERLTTVSR